MFGFKETQENVNKLFLETRKYVSLQKRLFSFELSQKLSELLSTLAVVAVAVLLGTMLLLFLAFFVAYTIGQLTGSTPLGFAVVALVVALLLILFYAKRQQWVVQPITALVKGIIIAPEEKATKEEVQEELSKSKERLADGAHQVLSPSSAPRNRAEGVAQWINRGLAVYQGVRIGMSVIRAFNSLFGGSKRRKRR